MNQILSLMKSKEEGCRWESGYSNTFWYRHYKINQCQSKFKKNYMKTLCNTYDQNQSNILEK